MNNKFTKMCKVAYYSAIVIFFLSIILASVIVWGIVSLKLIDVISDVYLWDCVIIVLFILISIFDIRLIAYIDKKFPTL